MQRIRSRAADFAAALPAIAAALDAAPLANAIRGASLAARLNAFLPSAVWKKPTPDAKAFYDPAQPRDNIGGWTNGFNVRNSVKLSKKELKGAPANPRKLYDNYIRNGGRPLAHDRLPASAEVTVASIKHHNATRTIKQRNAIINRPPLLQALFRRGHLSKVDVRQNKDGIPDTNKADWKHCWHVRGNVKINEINYAYDFTVFQRKSNNRTELYDFAIRDK